MKYTYKRQYVLIGMQSKILEWAHANDKQIHSRGYIVLGPPGIGKTTFVESHPRAWVDADEIFSALGLHTEQWHSEQRTQKEEEEHYRACDRALGDMRTVGLWVLGSLFWEFQADAIILIDAKTHQSYVETREDLSWSRVQTIRDVLEEMAKSKGIQIFETIKAAANKPTLKQYILKKN